MTGTDRGHTREITRFRRRGRALGGSSAQIIQSPKDWNPNPLNDKGALQRMIREMMEPEAGRPSYRKPYPAYIDQIPLSLGFKVPNFTLFNREDTHASSVEHIGRFSIHCIAIENNPLLKLMLFGNSLFRQAFTCRDEQQKRNSSKGTFYKTPSSSVHLVEVESEEGTEGSEEREVAVAEMAKLKHPISCKALTKPPKDQKPPPFTGGFVPNKPTQNKVYSFDLTMVDALFDEMLLQKAIEAPHNRPSINPASSSDNQLEPSQSEGQSGPIPVEGQEDWTEKYEEEQLDYEPFADNQIGLLETGEQEDWTDEYGEEQMEYDGELDEEIEAFSAELESLLQGDLGINMVPTIICASLKEPLKSEITALLHDFRDCFAWHYHEIPGLDRKLLEHKLPIKEDYLPIKQARRRMSMETELKVKEEIERLVKAGFIRPAIYAEKKSK
ncbi:unnamed protein product [Prunus brigantina]